MREPSHRLTQHKRRGGRSLLVLRDPEEAPTLFFKGSKPGAATAGWSLFLWAWLGRVRTMPGGGSPAMHRILRHALFGERFDVQRATRALLLASVETHGTPGIDSGIQDE